MGVVILLYLLLYLQVSCYGQTDRKYCSCVACVGTAQPCSIMRRVSTLEWLGVLDTNLAKAPMQGPPTPREDVLCHYVIAVQNLVPFFSATNFSCLKQKGTWYAYLLLLVNSSHQGKIDKWLKHVSSFPVHIYLELEPEMFVRCHEDVSLE